jgi:hypothetical protein
MAKHAEIMIGKIDILATYTYAKALLDGTNDSEAKERGIGFGQAESSGLLAITWCFSDKTSRSKY